jgi:hypothetical protein
VIRVGETSDPEREFVFHLAVGSSPTTGHSFSTGEVKYCLPGGSLYSNADVTRIVERGRGDYALRLTDAQVAAAGTITFYINASGADPVSYAQEIGPGILTNEATDSKREVVFHLSSGLTNVTGHSWLTGEIEICNPGGTSYANADVTRVLERGNGDYALRLTAAQVGAGGTGSLFINASGADPQNVTYEISDLGDIIGISFPAPANATTLESIRDRVIAVMEATTPAAPVKPSFIRYRNEGAARFDDWAENAAAGSLRRFQVRDDGSDEDAEVFNLDHMELVARFEIRIAYPQNSRAGRDNAMDRDDSNDSDWARIRWQLGPGYGRTNFSGSYPDAVPLEITKERETGNGVDFLIIRLRMSYIKTSVLAA